MAYSLLIVLNYNLVPILSPNPKEVTLPIIKFLKNGAVEQD